MQDRIQRLLGLPAFDQETEMLPRLINGLSLAAVVLAGLIMALRLALGIADIPILLLGLVLFAVGGVQFLQRQGQLWAAGVVLTTAVWLTITLIMWTHNGIYAPTYSLYMVVILLSGLLVGRKAIFLFAATSAIIGLLWVLQHNTTGMMSLLPSLLVWSIITSVGFLTTAVFSYLLSNTLTQTRNQQQQADQSLTFSREALEARVTERTHELSLAAEIGRAISQIQDVDLLLAEAVRLICDHFNLYHTQIYLVDKTARVLELKVGTGEIGAELRRQNHRLAIGSGSINGTAAAERKTIAVPDTTSSHLFQTNALLPDTRSEMSVPLQLGEQLLGLLNIQSKQTNALNQENTGVFEVLAGQLAVAIQNAEFFAAARDARRSLETQAKQTVLEGWQAYMDNIAQRDHLGYSYIGKELTPLTKSIQETKDDVLTVPVQLAGQAIGFMQLDRLEDQPWSRSEKELVDAVLQQAANRLENLRLLADAERFRMQAEQANRRLVHEAWRDYLQEAPTTGFVYDQVQVTAKRDTVPEATPVQTSVSSPVLVQGAAIGYLEAAAQRFSQQPNDAEAAAELVNVVADQLSIHIENLRLTQRAEVALADSQARAEELAFVNRIVSTISASLDLNKSLQFVLDELAAMLNISQARVALVRENYDILQVVNEHYDPALSPSAMHAEIPIADSPATETALRERRTMVIENPQTSPLTRSVHALMRSQGIETLVIIPLVAGNQALGTVGIDLLDKDRTFTPEEIRLAETVVFQAAAALQNAQLFQQTQKALAATELLYEGSDRIIKAGTLDEVLLALLQAPSLQGLDRAGLAFFDAPVLEGDRPVAFETAATWERVAGDTLEAGIRPSGIRYLLADYPAAQLLNDRHGVMLAHDIRTDERFDERSRQLFAEQYGMRGLINFPLVVGEAWIGSFTGLTRSLMNWTNEDLRQIVSLVDQAAVVLQNKILLADTERALQQTEQQAVRLAQLNSLSELLSTVGTPELALASVAQYAKGLFGDARLSVALLNEAKDAFAVVLLQDEMEELRLERWVPLAQTAVSDVIRNNHILVVDDTLHSQYSEMQTLREQGIRAMLTVPMGTPNGPMGALNMGSTRPQTFTEQDQNLFSQIASLLAATLENRRLLRQARQQVQRERVLNSINQKIRATTTVEGAMQTAIQELGKALRARYTQIDLYKPHNGDDG